MRPAVLSPMANSRAANSSLSNLASRSRTAVATAWAWDSPVIDVIRFTASWTASSLMLRAIGTFLLAKWYHCSILLCGFSIDGSHQVTGVDESRPFDRGRPNSAVAHGVGANEEPRRDRRQHFCELCDVPRRAVLETLENSLLHRDLRAVDACDPVHFGHTECAVAPLDMLLEAVVPDLGLPPRPQVG